jgi:hypothetical protein
MENVRHLCFPTLKHMRFDFPSLTVEAGGIIFLWDVQPCFSLEQLFLTALEAKRILILKLQKQGMQIADIFNQFENLNFNNLNAASI